MSSQGFGVNPGKTFTTTDLPLPVGVGSVGKTPYGTWMFVQASGAIDQYAAVVISDDGQAAMATTTNAGSNSLQVGIAQVAAANDEYLWVFVGGVGGGGTYTLARENPCSDPGRCPCPGLCRVSCPSRSSR